MLVRTTPAIASMLLVTLWRSAGSLAVTFASRSASPVVACISMISGRAIGLEGIRIDPVYGVLAGNLLAGVGVLILMVLLSAAGAVLLNFSLALNHRPDRCLGK